MSKPSINQSSLFIMLISKTFLVASLAAAASGYKLTFYDSATSRCGGQFLGSWKGDDGTDCSTDFAGMAQQVLITSDRDSDKDNTVIFFKNKSCDPAGVNHQGQAGCIAIDAGFGEPYQSFKVVKGSIGSNSKRAAEREEKTKRAEDVKRTADTEHIPDHGDYFDQDGQTWRWHKTSAGTRRGIPVHEWDDEVHVANHEADDLESDAKQLRGREMEARSELFERGELVTLDQRDSLICRLAAGCSVAVTMAGAGLKNYGGKAIDYASHAAAHAGQDLWTFLNSPFGAGMATASVSGGILFASIYVNNKYSPGAVKPEDCSGYKSQADLLKAAIDQATGLSDFEAAQITIDFENGRFSEVSISITKKGDKTECGAPEAKKNKSKRSLSVGA